MYEQNSADAKGNEPGERVPPVDKPEPVSSSGSQNNTQADLAEIKQELTEEKQEMNGFERATIRWTKASFIVILFTCLFIAFQWLEMRSGGKDTHDLAEAAKTQAEKMKSMSEAADKIREAAQGMVTQDQRIADNAQRALDASNRQSKSALDATIAQNRLDERPWIGIAVFRVSKFEEKKPIVVDIQIINSGKTPALSVSQWIRYQYGTISQLGPLPIDTVKVAWQTLPPFPLKAIRLFISTCRGMFG